MQQIHTPCAEEQYKLGAWLNAQTNNLLNRQHYSDEELLRVDRIAQHLKTHYTDAEFYINYRKTKATVKVVTGETHLHTVDTGLQQYMSVLAQQGVTVAYNANTSAVIYSIHKK